VREPSGNGYIYPAGIELRSWEIPTGVPIDRADQVVHSTVDRPAELVSDLFKKQIQWGRLLAEHRRILAEQIRDRAHRTRERARPGGAASQWADSWDAVADKAERGRATRTTAASRRDDVREAYKHAQRIDPRRVAVETLKQLQHKGYELNEANESDKTKVRRWISELPAEHQEEGE